MTKIENLKNLLSNGFVAFSYVKLDGSVRNAIGTTNHDIIYRLGHNISSNKERSVRNGNVVYFDLSRQSFRQFRSDNLISVSDYEFSSDYEALIYALSLIYSFTEYSADEFDDFINYMNDIKVGFGNDSKIFMINTVDSDSNDAHVAFECHKRVSSDMHDSHRDWCIKHNNGRGLNGVMLSAAGTGGSGCLGWPGGGSSRSVPVSEGVGKEVPTENKSRNKAEILADIAKCHTELSKLYAELSAAEMN